jgi:hypothetical protein
MITAAFLGALVGLGVVLVWVGLHPRDEALVAVLGRLGQPLPTQVRDEQGPQWVERLGRTRTARAYTGALASDLRVLGRRPDDEVVSLAIDIGAGLVAPVALAALAALFGLWLPPPLVVLASLVLAGFLGLSRWATVQAGAKSRRDELRYALAAFCDLTAMHLAAGRGVSQALETAAAQGDGWAFTEIRAALAGAASAAPRASNDWVPRSPSTTSSRWPAPSGWPARTAPRSAPPSDPRPAPSETASPPMSNARPRRQQNAWACPPPRCSWPWSPSTATRR